MPRRDNRWLRLASIGPHFLAATLIGYFLGSRLDIWFGTDPILTVLFALFGIAAGFINLFQEVQILNREDEANNDENDPEKPDQLS